MTDDDITHLCDVAFSVAAGFHKGHPVYVARAKVRRHLRRERLLASTLAHMLTAQKVFEDFSAKWGNAQEDHVRADPRFKMAQIQFDTAFTARIRSIQRARAVLKAPAR